MKSYFKRMISTLLILPGIFAVAIMVFSFSSKKQAEINAAFIFNENSQISIVITKKTTPEELEKIKAQMTKQGFLIDFNNVAYNEKGEIIAISILYKDANNNQGNYNVSSKKPINDIKIMSDGSRISVISAGSSNQAFISQGNGSMDSSNNWNDDHQKEMKKRKEQMEAEMEAQMKEMDERRMQMQMKMDKYRDSIYNLHEPKQINVSQLRIISKNTSNLELGELQKRYDSEDISLTYKDLVRNNNEEITHIAITIDNRAGSLSSSTFGNGKDAIKNIELSVDKRHTIMRSAD